MQASAPGYIPLTESTPPERKPFIDVSKPALRIGEYVSVRNDPVQGQVSGHYYHYHHYLHYHYYHHIKKNDEGSISKTSRADLKKQQEEWEQEGENLFQPYRIYRKKW